jgi:hypothetical protein
MTAFANAREALVLAEEIQERIERLARLLRPMAMEDAEPDVGGQILAEILEQGGSVLREELYRLAAAHGMDRRGLGGFFRQSGKASLYDVPGGRVLLTPYGVEQARRAIERRPTMIYKVGEPDFAKIAETSFAEEWDSDEDSVYDSL